MCELTAKQIENPQGLLLPVAERPTVLPRPFVRTDASYPGWVSRNVKSGLQKLKPKRSIAKHRRKTVISGIFAVEKDEFEDWCIMAITPQNALMDKRKFWRPRFASMPHVRAIHVAKGRRLRIHKIDGRHFFHMLRVGRRWQKYFASPPLPRVRGQEVKYPVNVSVPMGFTGSASWAQIFNEAIIDECKLPADRRLVDGQIAPGQLPVWGSILDGFWGVEEDTMDVAGPWMRPVTTAWETAGIIEHEKKRVDGDPVGEIQGAMFEGRELWVGLSREKRLALAEAGRFLMRCRRVHVRSVARWTGKAGFFHYFRPALRCLFSDIYTWVDLHRRADKHRAVLWPSVRREIGQACMLLAFAQTDLSLPFCPRLEASDASPGGHGRAYTYVAGG